MSKPYPLPADCPYAVTSLKTFLGNEGYGYEATITLNGKKALIAVDDAHGGSVAFHPVGKPKGNGPDAWTAVINAQRDAEAALEAYAKTLPNYPPCELFKDGLSMTGELLVAELVNALIEHRLREKNRKKFEKLCLTETLFRLKGDKPGAWRTYVVTADRGVPYTQKKHGDAIEVILNTLIGTDPYAWEAFS